MKKETVFVSRRNRTATPASASQGVVALVGRATIPDVELRSRAGERPEREGPAHLVALEVHRLENEGLSLASHGDLASGHAERLGEPNGLASTRPEDIRAASRARPRRALTPFPRASHRALPMHIKSIYQTAGQEGYHPRSLGTPGPKGALMRHSRIATLFLLALLTFFGVIHSASPDGLMYLPWTLTGLSRQVPFQFAGAYCVLAVMLLLLSLSRESREVAQHN
jgi:hypothetical protein